MCGDGPFLQGLGLYFGETYSTFNMYSLLLYMTILEQSRSDIVAASRLIEGGVGWQNHTVSGTTEN
jgi:hypothetical protein